MKIFYLLVIQKLQNFIMSLNREFDYLFKILIIGNSAVGKSSLMLRFSDNIFPQSFLPTIGVDFKITTMEDNGNVIKLQIWDTAGQERFKTITANYYKGAHGIILVYNVTDRRSFQDIQNWLQEINKHGKQNVVKLLVGNKSDLKVQRQVSEEQGKQLANSLGINFIETSAKNSINIDQAFKLLVNQIKKYSIKIDNSNKIKPYLIPVNREKSCC